MTVCLAAGGGHLGWASRLAWKTAWGLVLAPMLWFMGA